MARNHWLNLKTTVHQILEVMPVLTRRPGEFADRLLGILDNRWLEPRHQPPAYDVHEIRAVYAALSEHFDQSADDILGEVALSDIETTVKAAIEALPTDAPFPQKHHADFALARFAYLICRLVQPEVVVETGVAYGVTSAFILKAMEVNGRGTLFSIDLPASVRADASQYVGHLIPADLRPRWKLTIGASRRVLRPLLQEVGTPDIFLHDSLHTYRNMRYEFASIKRPRVILSDDIEGNAAFQDLIGGSSPVYAAVAREQNKSGYFGICIYP